MRLDKVERPPLEAAVHRLYTICIGQYVANRLTKQRLKLLWYAPGYWPILFLPNLSLLRKFWLLARLLRIDWKVLHGHTPYECAMVCRALAERPSQLGETMIESGCWEGGSSAKWSLMCQVMGYHLIIYDSFEGVEVAASPVGEYDYSGEYAAQEEVVWQNLKRYGAPDSCRTVKGWFCETMGAGKITNQVRLAYIDCDTAKGTKEALTGIIPAMTKDCVIFSQDCHIPSVLRFLTNPSTWKDFKIPIPRMQRLERRLVRLDMSTP